MTSSQRDKSPTEQVGISLTLEFDQYLHGLYMENVMQYKF